MRITAYVYIQSNCKYEDFGAVEAAPPTLTPTKSPSASE
jgi:hypothetical protein